MKDESLQIWPYGLLVSASEPPVAAVGFNGGDIKLSKSSLLCGGRISSGGGGRVGGG